jgi:NAD(P)-dependent dehydrogenase (short-subunit alcohol dehydrogenase family)
VGDDAPLPLSGSSALVTGAGRGIGRATAAALASAGARVLLCARTESEVTAAADEIRKRTGGGETLAFAADVTIPSEVRRLSELVRDRWGNLDVVVNNAAILGPVGRLVDVSMADWIGTLISNVGSVATISHYMIPLMRDGGSIINLSGAGIGGDAVQERVSAYAASKAAVVVLTEALAGECAARRIRVNAVAPGAVATRFAEAILRAGPARAGQLAYEATIRQREAPDRLDDFLRMVVWLASGQSSWLTGRLLSARWDSIERLERLRSSIPVSSLLTLRRIDGELFAPMSDIGSDR